ncbi:MAG: TIGR00341 family protein [Bacteroidetes bacterium]|nr:MAG: TIGR00341 family protein [Bacteroidota bacterium]
MIRQILNFIDLRKEVEDHASIHEQIEKGVIFRGTNLWILVFAIIIASVGLNTNSTAVIIGAMLISPLMGPINGMGYSVATYNYQLFQKSLKNFGFSVVASLIASTLYFAITPVSTAHSELLARTQPTIYDVIIAFFGGLAGIVATSSRIKGNILPGVAIATALMPPLCTAGFGLATGQFNYFLGALYLFTINTVFIGISSMLVSRFLKFPIRTFVNESQKKKVKQSVTALTLITIIPSLYFGYRFIQNEKFRENAKLYCQNVRQMGDAFLLDHRIEADGRNITLIYGGNTLQKSEKENIRKRAEQFNLSDAVIQINQGFSYNQSSLNEADVLRNKIDQLSQALKNVEAKRDSIIRRPEIGENLLKEIKTLYPMITSCSYSDTKVYADTSNQTQNTALVVFSVPELSLDMESREELSNWLKQRLKNEKVKALFEEYPVDEENPGKDSSH